MSYVHLVSTAGFGSNAPAINTTGATLLVAGAIDQGPTPSLSDSYGNTWMTVLESDLPDPPSDAHIRVYYCVNPIVGPNHTFTNSVSVGNVQVAAFTGNAAEPVSVSAWTKNFAFSTTTALPSPLTPPEDRCLVVALATLGGNSSNPQIAGFTRTAFTNGLAGSNYGGYIGHQIQTAATPVTPTMTYTTEGRPVLAAVVFLPTPPPATPPSVTSQPSSTSVVEGQSATFSVAASGTAPLTYQWRRNGTNIAGATGSSYTTPATVLADNGATFSVVVSNSAGSATSNNATLSVTEAPPAPDGTIGNFSLVGQVLTMSGTCTSTTLGSITVPAAAIPLGAVGRGPLPITVTGNTWAATINGLAAGAYAAPQITLSNASGSRTLTGTAFDLIGLDGEASPELGNSAPTVILQPTAQTVTAGASATFSSAASGLPTPTVQWQRSDNGGSTWANIAGATSATFSRVTTLADNGARFRAVWTNTEGSATSNAAILTVNAAVVAPSITAQPASQTLTAGQTATFSVSAVGTAPLAYQWRRNGVNISGATSASYTTPALTTADNGATFSVSVSNSAGAVVSSNATLTVAPALTAPTITLQPQGRTVIEGQSATFTAAATGTEPLTYQWRRNGVDIPGATSNVYTLATVLADSGAVFTLRVSNAVGAVDSAAALLTVNAGTAPIPVINAVRYETALSRVLPYVNGCPDQTAIFHLQQAGIEFFQRTLAWKYAPPTVKTVPGTTKYAMTLPEGAVTQKVLTYTYEGTERHVVTPEQGYALRSSRNSAADAVWTVDRTAFEVHPTPREAGKNIDLLLALKPSQAAEQIPGELWEQYIDAICKGAIGSLLMLPAQGWSNPALGAEYRQTFENQISKVAAATNRGNSRAFKRVRPFLF